MADEERLAMILPILEIDLQAVRHFEAWDEDGIAQFRRVGRRAVRQLGHRALTRESDPAKREDGRVVVVVLADVDPEHSDGKRLEERAEEIVRSLSVFDSDGRSRSSVVWIEVAVLGSQSRICRCPGGVGPCGIWRAIWRPPPSINLPVHVRELPRTGSQLLRIAR